MSPEEARQEVIRRIEEARAEGAWLLDLGDLPLDELPEELSIEGGERVRAAGSSAVRVVESSVRWESDHRTGCTLADIGALPTLMRFQALGLYDCREVTDIGPLAKLTSLQSVDLGGTGV